MTTALYAALLALIFIVLSVAVVRQRRRFQVALGDGGHAPLQRAIRAHANFAEYVPLALLVLFLAEYSGLQPTLVHLLGIILLCARISHAFGVSRAPEQLKFRAVGILLTFIVLLLSALAVLVIYIIRHMSF